MSTVFFNIPTIKAIRLLKKDLAFQVLKPTLYLSTEFTVSHFKGVHRHVQTNATRALFSIHTRVISTFTLVSFLCTTETCLGF